MRRVMRTTGGVLAVALALSCGGGNPGPVRPTGTDTGEARLPTQTAYCLQWCVDTYCPGEEIWDCPACAYDLFDCFVESF